MISLFKPPRGSPQGMGRIWEEYSGRHKAFMMFINFALTDSSVHDYISPSAYAAIYRGRHRAEDIAEAFPIDLELMVYTEDIMSGGYGKGADASLSAARRSVVASAIDKLEVMYMDYPEAAYLYLPIAVPTVEVRRIRSKGLASKLGADVGSVVLVDWVGIAREIASRLRKKCGSSCRAEPSIWDKLIKRTQEPVSTEVYMAEIDNEKLLDDAKAWFLKQVLGVDYDEVWAKEFVAGVRKAVSNRADLPSVKVVCVSFTTRRPMVASRAGEELLEEARKLSETVPQCKKNWRPEPKDHEEMWRALEGAREELSRGLDLVKDFLSGECTRPKYYALAQVLAYIRGRYDWLEVLHGYKPLRTLLRDPSPEAISEMFYCLPKCRAAPDDYPVLHAPVLGLIYYYKLDSKEGEIVATKEEMCLPYHVVGDEGVEKLKKFFKDVYVKKIDLFDEFGMYTYFEREYIVKNTKRVATAKSSEYDTEYTGVVNLEIMADMRPNRINNMTRKEDLLNEAAFEEDFVSHLSRAYLVVLGTPIKLAVADCEKDCVLRLSRVRGWWEEASETLGMELRWLPDLDWVFPHSNIKRAAGVEPQHLRGYHIENGPLSPAEMSLFRILELADAYKKGADTITISGGYLIYAREVTERGWMENPERARPRGYHPSFLRMEFANDMVFRPEAWARAWEAAMEVAAAVAEAPWEYVEPLSHREVEEIASQYRDYAVRLARELLKA